MQFIRSMANCTLVGRLGGPPEPIGDTGCQISIAVKELLPQDERDRGRKDREDRTHWFRVAIWGEARAKWCMENLNKGDIVSCSAQLSTNEYRPDGSKKPIMMVNFSVPPTYDFVQLHRHQPDEGGPRRQGKDQGRDQDRSARQDDRRVEYDDGRDPPPDDRRGSSYSRDLPPPEPAQERRGRGGRRSGR
jgi:single-stranded DNA-binding protein